MINTPEKTIQVIKRDGRKEELDVAKIKAVIDWACEGLDVNPLLLGSSLTTRLKDGVTTREIQDNLVDAAATLASAKDPHWTYVAGRLHMWGKRKDIRLTRGYEYDFPSGLSSYVHFVKKMVADGLYDKRLIEYYDDIELAYVATHLDPLRDKDFDYAGSLLLYKKYLLPNELPQEAFLTIALLLAIPHKEENRLQMVIDIYDAISKRYISLATPILSNLRKPGGSLTSCFIIATNDSLKSIFSNITNVANISAAGGGVGFNFSKIRAVNAPVRNRPNSSGGVVPWLSIVNQTAVAVNQG